MVVLVRIRNTEPNDHVVDEGRIGARGIATGRLNLDHIGTHVGQQHGAEGAGHKLGKVEDLDAGKGPFAGHGKAPNGP